MNEIYKEKRAWISYVRSLRVFHHFGKFSQLCSKKFCWCSYARGLCPFLLLLLFSPAPFVGALYKYHKM